MVSSLFRSKKVNNQPCDSPEDAYARRYTYVIVA